MQQTGSSILGLPPTEAQSAPPVEPADRVASPPPRCAVGASLSNGVCPPPAANLRGKRVAPPPPPQSRYAPRSPPPPAASRYARFSRSPPPAHAYAAVTSAGRPTSNPLLPEMAPVPVLAGAPESARSGKGGRPPVRRYFIDSYNANLRNEDRSIVDVSDEDYHMFGVFDGHGGPECSTYIEQNITAAVRSERDRLLKLNPECAINWAQVLKTTLMKLDDTFITDGGANMNTKGSCVILCVVTHDKVYTANVGDSRAVLGTRDLPRGAKTMTPFPLSVDQDCQNEREVMLVKQRTRDDNPVRRGRANAVGTAPLRVAGSLMVTRAMGDSYLKREGCSMPPYRVNVPYITSEPVITEHHFDPSRDHSIVLGSDGLYNMLTNEEVVQLAESAMMQANPPNPPQYLIGKALEKVCMQHNLTLNLLRCQPAGPKRRMMHDDITVIHILLGVNDVYNPNALPIISQQTTKERENAERRSRSPAPPDGLDLDLPCSNGSVSRLDSTIAISVDDSDSQRSAEVASQGSQGSDKQKAPVKGARSRTPPPKKARGVMALLQSSKPRPMQRGTLPPPGAFSDRPGSAPTPSLSSPLTPGTPATPATPATAPATPAATPATPVTPATPASVASSAAASTASLKRSASEIASVSPPAKRFVFKKPVSRGSKTPGNSPTTPTSHESTTNPKTHAV
eukprot:TRINITY_DN1504_c1_g1_i2.p1 TRINITY_DN1504_c1_g1~~TRINITY_DN1504_c1_g1_i2.p1  ORF type:complete len:724 (+),score=83.08 TRINITY_DN1504_c1_g1_i2:129-2174(+)